MGLKAKHKSVGDELTKAEWEAEDSHTIEGEHAQQHAITAIADHTSGATPAQMLQADANGLPIDATNTNTDVADAVTKKHANTLDHSDELDHSHANKDLLDAYALTEIVVLKPGDTANNTTALVDAAGLSFSVLANKTYIIEGFIVWDSSATSVGIRLSATGPVSPTRMAGHFEADAANGTPDGSSFNANDVVVTTSASPFTAGCIAALHCILVNGVNPGTFQLRFAAETTGTVTIKAGSCLRYRQVN